MELEIGSVLPDATCGAQDPLALVAFMAFDELIDGFADQFAPLLALLTSDGGKQVSLPTRQVDLGSNHLIGFPCVCQDHTRLGGHSA